MNEELIKGYIKDYLEKTGDEIVIHLNSQLPKIRKFVGNYICKYNVILSNGKKGKRTPEETNKIYLLRWILKNKYNLSDADVAHWTNCDRTYAYRSIKIAQGLLDVNDDKFMEIYNLVISE